MRTKTTKEKKPSSRYHVTSRWRGVRPAMEILERVIPEKYGGLGIFDDPNFKPLPKK